MGDQPRSPLGVVPECDRLRRGVLLVNLGSPTEPTTGAVRRYLDEFLADPLVVDMNPILWWFIRKGIILPLRGPKSARLYQSIWTPEGSPLIVGSTHLRDALAQNLGPEVPMHLAMRYGEPGIRAAILSMIAEGVEVVRLLPLFPQGSRTTTGTVEGEVRRILATLPDGPKLEVMAPYYEDPGYVEALSTRIREHTDGLQVDHHLFSFHGLPVRYIREGDPYQGHCEATARALAESLELPADGWTLTYQSRFGREPWLEPNTVDVARDLATRGRRVAVTCPGFAVDCLETLEEIGTELAETVVGAGGPALAVVPALNDHPAWVEALARIVSPPSSRA